MRVKLLSWVLTAGAALWVGNILSLLLQVAFKDVTGTTELLYPGRVDVFGMSMFFGLFWFSWFLAFKKPWAFRRS